MIWSDPVQRDSIQMDNLTPCTYYYLYVTDIKVKKNKMYFKTIILLY